jgi:hypothetical protein
MENPRVFEPTLHEDMPLDDPRAQGLLVCDQMNGFPLGDMLHSD